MNEDSRTKRESPFFEKVTKRSMGAVSFKCPLCPYKHKFPSRLKTHFNNRHNPNPVMHKCPHCDYKAKQKNTLDTHLKITHNPNAKVFSCPLCKYTTKFEKSFKSHVFWNHQNVDSETK